MTITVELPNDIGEQADPGQVALEALALEAYRTGSLSHEKAARLLNMGRIAFDDLLKSKGEFDRFYGVEDLLEDIRTSDELLAQGPRHG
ncbi:MAG: UPF0175 family protein [Acidobacteriota bacterium]